ncbi:RloB family protein [Streptomyces sp. TRM 70361]|uniref:RloB family protein n=1 Tax=Streptomyces sp. TRM 70361 TaxID=3116553 RepID=UPI002E7B581A|nr:RloB family protein [Streptomyces sp. TRM 70361]MEE1938289.1 RloB family protein [Streptomyces sp. TRM 70361]
MRRGRGDLSRKKGILPERKRFLIYCEGECTEDQYFKGLKSDLRSLPVEIRMGNGKGEPRSLVQAAIDHQRRAPRSPEDRRTAYDEVWCVVDVEAPRPHPGLPEAMRLARKSSVNIALTNPCFELWVLLHFTDVTAYATSDRMQRLLEGHAECGYSARRKHLKYEVLRDRFEKARDRARFLRERAEGGQPTRSNPWTDVDLLVDALRRARHGRT